MIKEKENKYEKKLLTLLVEKYRKSKKDDGSQVINRHTRISPNQLYKKYDQNGGNPEEINAVNECIINCFEKGFVTYDTVYLSNEIPNVFLIDEKIEVIEDYLEQRYAYQSKASKRKCVQKIIETFEGTSPTADRICRKFQEILDKNKIPKDYEHMQEVLKAVTFIENNHEALFLREASMMIYGSSKVLEEPKLLAAVCRELRATMHCECGEDALPDEILSHFGIRRERQKICLKGKIKIQWEDRGLDLSTLKNGFECVYEDLMEATKIILEDKTFMTVENYTAWMRMKKLETTVFYLGGYATRDQRNFLKKVYADNPEVTYFHFGDIDAGGFYIYEHLCRITGIPFKRYLMSVEVLKNPLYRFCHHSLSEHDRNRLKELQKKRDLEEITTYMLEHNVKLEQEIVSFHEMEGIENRDVAKGSMQE